MPSNCVRSAGARPWFTVMRPLSRMASARSASEASVVSCGGSIATVTGDGVLQVGPRSAGADPGPACYGLGGDQPTVTDANVVLGRLSPDRRAAVTLHWMHGYSVQEIADMVGAPANTVNARWIAIELSKVRFHHIYHLWPYRR